MADEFKDASPLPWTVDKSGDMLDANGEQVGSLMPARRAQNAALATRAVGAFGPMREVLCSLEWDKKIRGVGWCCPSCYGHEDDGHSKDCAMDAALRAANGEASGDHHNTKTTKAEEQNS